jgi:protein-S-isoprenylcysteine O-methyltransferase Ste14
MFTKYTLILALYIVGFAAVHSLLADLRLKGRAERTLGRRAMRWYRLFFTLFAAATISPLLYLLYLFPGEVLYLVPSPWRWIMIAGQVLAALAFGKTFVEAGPLQFLGIVPDDGEGKLIVQGVYCRVRNPLFLFALIFLWLSPIMTENLLALYLIATVYFYLGSVHEERTLAEKFGDVYRDYQRRVPRIVPRLHCRYPETRVEAAGDR